MSTKLIQTQQEFFKCILKQKNDFSDHIVSDDLNAHTRLAIYVNGYRYRLIDVLKVEFPKLCHLLGDDVFNDLALDYIHAHPSTHYSVRYFGHALAAFIAEKNFHPALSELAQFEWSLGETQDAGDARPVTWEEIQAHPPDLWPELTFSLHPSCRLLSLQYPVPALWQRLSDPNIEQVDCPEVLENPMDWLLWRDGIQSFFISLNAPYAALLKISLGYRSDSRNLEIPTFADLCYAATQYVPEEDFSIWMVEFLQFCIHKKILVTYQPTCRG